MMGRGRSPLRGGSGGGGKLSFKEAIMDKYPNAVIGEFKDGEVTFKYSPNGKEYKYKANNMQELADRVGAKTGKGLEGNKFLAIQQIPPGIISRWKGKCKEILLFLQLRMQLSGMDRLCLLQEMAKVFILRIVSIREYQ